MSRMAVNSLLSILAVTSLSPELMGQCWKLLAQDRDTHDNYGYCVSAHEDRALVGAPSTSDAGYRSGSAYIHRYDGTHWVEEQRLTASDAAEGNLFGAAGSIKGTLAVIGAPDRHEVDFFTGAVYVFRFDGSLWVEEQKLIPPDADGGQRFGASVSLSEDGNLLAVGSPGDSEHAYLSGAAYLFRFDGSLWQFEHKFVSEEPTRYGRLGVSVSIDPFGGLLAIGSVEDSDAGVDGGSAYVFTNENGFWQQQQVIRPPNLSPEDYFGLSLSLDRGVLAVGCYGDDEQGTDSGSVYVYRHSLGLWVEEQVLAPLQGAAEAWFGYSVQLRADALLVGSSLANVSGNRYAGSASLFRHNGTDWVERRRVFAPDATQGARLGSAVALSEIAAFGGAFGDDTGTGAVYVYHLGNLAESGNYGLGWPGTHGVPGISVSDPPVLGTEITLRIDNSRFDEDTSGFLLIGTKVANVKSPFEGVVLVTPRMTLPIVLPAFGQFTFSAELPEAPELLGVPVYLQAMELDEGASLGVSFTPGLEGLLGDC